MSYCSKECQTQDWRRGHKKDCQKIGNTERQAIPGGTAGQNCSDDDGVPVTPYLEKCAVCGSFDKLKACHVRDAKNRNIVLSNVKKRTGKGTKHTV